MSPASKSQPRKRTAARKKSTTPKKVKTAKVKSQRKSVIDDSIVADTITLGHRAEILSDLDEIVAIEDSSVANDKDENYLGQTDQEKLSIESILSGEATNMQPSQNKTSLGHGGGFKKKPARRRRLRWSVFVPLIVTILVILVLAEGTGLFDGAGRKGAAKFLSSIGSVFGIDGDNDIEVQPTVLQPVLPSLVSISVLVSASAQEEGLAIPVVQSRLIETDVAASDSFPATGSAPAEEARSVGTITIVNETSNNYRFVATTRFLSPDGVLFRMKEASDIPANGTVDVEVYADEVGVKGDIEPSQFVIPGLSQDLQQSIYGRSRAAMTGGGGTVVAVANSDLETARTELMGRLLTEAQANFKAMISVDELILDDLITSKELKSEYPKSGTPGRTFTAKTSVQFSTLVVPEAEILILLDKKMVESLPDGLSEADYTLSDPLYTVEAYDTISGRAELRVEAPLQKL